MFHNPTAAVNLFHVGKQYLTFCKAEATVTHNLIGRKIISNVKHSDARNSLPILDVIRSSDKRHSASNERYVKRQVSVVRVYTCSERHLTFGRNIDTRRQWSVGNIGWNEWLSWEIIINDHCLGSVSCTFLLLLYSGGDTLVSMLTHVYPHKPPKKIMWPSTLCVAWCLIRWFVSMIPSVLAETRCH